MPKLQTGPAECERILHARPAVFVVSNQKRRLDDLGLKHHDGPDAHEAKAMIEHDTKTSKCMSHET